MSEYLHPSSLKWRLFLCLVAGAAVSVITIVTQWAGNGSDYSWAARGTSVWLDNIHYDIEQYRKDHGELPGNLAELETETGRPIRDGWRRPLEYVRHGDTYELYSLGQDGKPGGKGINADMYWHEHEWPIAQPTLYQFVFEIPAGKFMSTGAILAGLCTFLIALLPTFRPTAKPKNWTSLIIKLFITVMVCTIMAGWMTILDIPSGH